LGELLVAVLMGIIEGLTEFLPVSSTGHLIVAGELFNLSGEKGAAFEIFIQLGAVLAVVWDYRRPLGETARGVFSQAPARRFAAALCVAFLPAAAVGLMSHRWIEAHLFSSWSVAGALIVGGFAILAVEAVIRRRSRRPVKAAFRYDDAMAIPLSVAFWIGLAQVLSLYPGVSRAAATILGGLLVGLSRKAATEFSFYLAIPTLGAACLFSLAQVARALSPGDAAAFAAGLISAFITAAVVIRLFLAWVRSRDFKPFAWYRIALGLVLMLVLGWRGR